MQRLLNPLFALFDTVVTERSPREITLGLLLGLCLGLLPADALHWWLAAGAIVVLRANPLAVILTAVLAYIPSLALESWFDAIGLVALTTAPDLHRLWAGLYHAPVLTFLRLNNTYVMGVSLMALLLSFPLASAALWVHGAFGHRLLARFLESPIWVYWTTTPLFIVYFNRNGRRRREPASRPPKTGWVRRRMILPVTVLVVVPALLGFLLVDAVLKELVESEASRLQGARVSIDSLRIGFLKGDLEIRGVRVAHHVNSGRNLVEIDRVYAHFLPEALLRRKILVEFVTVEGVHAGTPRQDTGTIPVTREMYGVPGLMDRVAAGFFTELRHDLSDNPLIQLGKLATGFDVVSRIDTLRASLSTTAKLRELRGKLEKISDAALKAGELVPTDHLRELQARLDKHLSQQVRSPASTDKDSLRALEAEIRDQHGKLSNAVSPLQTSLEAIEFESNAIDNLVASDIALLRSRLGLPRMDFDDLTKTMVGPRLLGYLERLTYWISLSRRRMPRGSRLGQVTFISQPNARGTTLHFGKMSTQPSILIRRMVFNSTPAPGTTLARVRGTAEGFTSDPPILGAPAQFEMEADFPNLGIEGLRISGLVDHSGEGLREEFKASVAELPLAGWKILDGRDPRLEISSGKATVNAWAKYDTNDLTAHWSAHLSNTRFKVSAQHHQTEATLREILAPVLSFNISADVSGNLDKLSLAMSSELGKHLAEGLRREYRHEIAAVDDGLRRSLLDEIVTSRNLLRSRLEEVRDRALGPALGTVAALERMAGATARAAGIPPRLTRQPRRPSPGQHHKPGP